MVAAAVAPSAARLAVARGQIDVGRRERVRQVVRRHLRSPSLRPKTLCRLVGMSRSNLYRLFEEKGGVAQYIQGHRLVEAHAILADPANTKPISVLAEDLCFAEASSFSRAFKREFGGTPSELRSAALAGLAPLPRPHRRGSSMGSDFSELQRNLSSRRHHPTSRRRSAIAEIGRTATYFDAFVLNPRWNECELEIRVPI
jgi:AraC-like DNA-binding protein